MLLVLVSQALTVRRKQSCFNIQNIPILGAGAADAAGAVFRDTGLSGSAGPPSPFHRRTHNPNPVPKPNPNANRRTDGK